MYGIVKLRNISKNEWEAKFQGNYGLYTIKITTDGKNTTDFFCSCPSDRYPCKHISYVEEAIAKKIADNKKKDNHLQLNDFIKNVPVDELREFIISQAEYNIELQNAIFLEYSNNIKNTNYNKYSMILRKALSSVSIDVNDYYHKDWFPIDVMDQWLNKAEECKKRKQYDDTILICKACIEEYSDWLYDIDVDISSVFSSEYQSLPFDIIISALKHTDKKDLFDYCLLEMKKKKYRNTDFFYEFQRLIKKLKTSVDTDAFIIMQDKLLNEVKDKSSHEAENILRQKIFYFRCLSQKKNAWTVIKDNIQIKSFCLKVAKKKIDKKEFQEAKDLIYNYLKNQKENADNSVDNTWDKLLLDIAQKENDLSSVRKFSYELIKENFDNKFYQIYKATFDPLEWIDEREKLFLHYCSKEYFNKSTAGLLKAEKDKDFLKSKIEKLLSLDKLENYYKDTTPDYHEKIYKMFRIILSFYAENYTGRYFYEHILLLLKRLSDYKDGKKTALDLKKEFQRKYDKRTLMIEVLGKL